MIDETPEEPEAPCERLSQFRSADIDVEAAGRMPQTPQTLSPAHKLAFQDLDFLMRDALRPVRLQLELLKPELILQEYGVDSTTVMFGGARIPAPEEKEQASTPMLASLTRYYEEARKFAALSSAESLRRRGREFVVVTGGGPGVMEAGNRGASEAGARSIGLGIVLPHEQAPNAWVSPEFSFNFHYFAVRKMHFLMRAAAVAVFPGGYGTLDELFETLTLIQTQRMSPVPIMLFGEEFWRGVVDFERLAEAGVISPEDLDLFCFVEDAESAWAHVMERCAGRSPER